MCICHQQILMGILAARGFVTHGFAAHGFLKAFKSLYLTVRFLRFFAMQNFLETIAQLFNYVLRSEVKPSHFTVKRLRKDYQESSTVMIIITKKCRNN